MVNIGIKEVIKMKSGSQGEIVLTGSLVLLVGYSLVKIFGQSDKIGIIIKDSLPIYLLLVGIAALLYFTSDKNKEEGDE